MNMDLKQIINTLWRWKILILSILGVTVVGLIILVFTADDSYTAYVDLQVTAPETEAVSLFGAVRYAGEREAVTIARNNFSVVVESVIIREQVIQELGLSEKEGEYELELRPVPDSDFLTIAFTSTSPELAATIANTHIQKSIVRQGNLRSLPAQQQLEELFQELEDAESSLRASEAALTTFQEEHELTSSLQTEIDTHEQRLQRLVLNRSDLLISDPFSGNNEVETINLLLAEREAELIPLLETRHTYNQLLMNLSLAQENFEDLAASSGVNLSAATLPEPLNSARNAVDIAETAVNEFNISVDINTVENDIAQLNTLIEELKLERDRRLTAPSENLQNARVLTIDALIAESEERVDTLSRLEPEFNFLSIQATRATDDYNFILEKYNQAEIVAASTESADFIQIITLATPPDEPSSSLRFLLVFGVAGALGTSIFLAFILEYFTNPSEEGLALDGLGVGTDSAGGQNEDGYQFPIRLHQQAQGD
ncbi:MAG: Wzz/FepE/Etk N-terminal domain-containing protein [Chloroflexota bacterium]